MNMLYNITHLIFLILSEQHFNIRIGYCSIKKLWLKVKKKRSATSELLFEKNKFHVDRIHEEKNAKCINIQQISEIFAGY